MPARDGQPIGQLIGGGPSPAFATLIHGTATRETLTLKVSKLDGTLVGEATLRA